MFRCPECGHETAEAVNFCPNCGAALKTSTGDTTRVIPLPPQLGDDTGELTDPALRALADVPPGGAVLVVVRGPNAGSTVLLDQETITAGRHPQSDIFLDDVTVSRHHAKFTERGGISLRAILQDEGTEFVLVRFEVEDSGVGIASATHKVIA